MSTPVRLEKKEAEISMLHKCWDKIETFILKHSTFFIILWLSILMLLFIVLAFTLVGLSATESGNIYNHLSDVI